MKPIAPEETLVRESHNALSSRGTERNENSIGFDDHVIFPRGNRVDHLIDA
jgi:hypothetical protein